jgi:predicted metal-dependent hydrolase
MEYQLIRSKRKTIAICVNRDGSVAVRAPLRAAQRMIDRFVREKQDWITEKSTQMATNAAVRENFNITVGSALPLLGQEYPVVQGEKIAFTGSCFTIPDEDFATLKPKLIALYKILAQTMIPERTAYFSKQTALFPTNVRIGSANTYWGCCSGKNSLNFSYKLIMAEPEVIDYVVVHELAHTVEHNHSARFWQLVQEVLPDYKERRAKLRLLEKKLQKQDWS